MGKMKMKVIAINGVSLAGKDTFVRLVSKHADADFCGVECISTIDPIKDFYSKLGWDGIKTPKHRKNLNLLKTMWSENCNGPLNWVKEQIWESERDNVAVLFIMVREFSEMVSIADLGQRMTGYGATMCVERSDLDIPPIEQDFLDSHPGDYRYDWVIDNPTCDGPLIKLDRKAKAFWDLIQRSNVCTSE